MAAPLPGFLFGGSARDARRAGGRAQKGGSSRGGSSRSGAIEKSILGVPERFMRPRIVLIVVTAILVCFGLLMIYSASSVTCIASDALGNDPAYYLKRQAIFAAIGAVLAALLARADYHSLSRDHLVIVIGAVIVGLVLVYVPGFSNNTYGASRWIKLFGGFQLQPSEFAKVAIVTVAASLAQHLFVDGDMDYRELVKYFLLGVGLPIALILAQPDKGSTLIIVLALAAMAFVAGISGRLIVGIGAVVVAVVAVYSFTQDYSLSRIQTFLDPWSDQLGDSYQLIQGFYAFGSGGLFGVGIGFSKQKYSYLPMAHNDFIFAVIGEECGLVGTVGVLVGFGVFAWAGVQIAKNAPDLTGRLIASGCTSLIIIQLLVNVCGVVQLIPLSGKPLPFLSYGGSSIMSCLMFVGMLISVSRQSAMSADEQDRRDGRRRPMRAGAGEGDPGLSFVGEVTPRSERYGSRAGSDAGVGGFTVVDGGRGAGAGRGGAAGYGRSGRGGDAGRPRGGSSARGGYGRGARGAEGGYERIDLNREGAGERLRARGGRDRRR